MGARYLTGFTPTPSKAASPHSTSSTHGHNRGDVGKAGGGGMPEAELALQLLLVAQPFEAASLPFVGVGRTTASFRNHVIHRTPHPDRRSRRKVA